VWEDVAMFPGPALARRAVSLRMKRWMLLRKAAQHDGALAFDKRNYSKVQSSFSLYAFKIVGY
jgi:hypothetical protein